MLHTVKTWKVSLTNLDQATETSPTRRRRRISSSECRWSTFLWRRWRRRSSRRRSDKTSDASTRGEERRSRRGSRRREQLGLDLGKKWNTLSYKNRWILPADIFNGAPSALDGSTCCILKYLKILFIKLNESYFIREKCRHLKLCFWMMKPFCPFLFYY